MTKSENTDQVSNAPAEAGLIAQLKAHKAANTGENDTTLPETGVIVTWPKFQPHGVWMKAQRLAKKNPFSVSDYYLSLLCKFNGERMTIDEFKSLIPTGDVLHLGAEVLGDDEDDEAGND